MKKQVLSKKQYCCSVPYLVATAAAIVLFSFNSYSCGGGVVPYVPTQTGASGNNSSSNADFYILEKGVATSMFDVKKFQPLFRNIILSGNERKKNKKSRKKSSQKNIAATQQKTADSTTVSHGDDAAPVLNIHRLH